MKFSEVFQVLEIRNLLVDQKLPIRVSYKFTRFFNELENEAKFFNDTLQKLIEEYGKKDEEGNYIYTEDKQGVKIQDDKFQECMDKIDELNKLEVNLTYAPEFTLDELEPLNLEMKYIDLLLPYIKD